MKKKINKQRKFEIERKKSPWVKLWKLCWKIVSTVEYFDKKLCLL